MANISILEDEVQSELIKIVKAYYDKLLQVRCILAEHDIRQEHRGIMHRLSEIHRAIDKEFAEDRKELKLLKKLNSITEAKISETLKSIRGKLDDLNCVLLKQKACVDKLLKKYDYNILLELFGLIVNTETIKYTGYTERNPEEEIIVEGLYPGVKKASEELIEFVTVLEDKTKIIESSEKEDKDAVKFVNSIIDFVKDNKIDTVIFIDKSARPFSYAFLLLYKKRHLFGRPKIFNFNWHKNSRMLFDIKYSDWHKNEYTKAFLAKDSARIREIAISKTPFLKNLSKNCVGRNILIVDDVVDQATTIDQLKEYMKLVFEPKRIYIQTFAKNSWVSRDSVPAFIKDAEVADRDLHWVKGIRGVGLTDSKKGYSTSMKRKYRRYSAQFAYLDEKINIVKRHIEAAVEKHG